MSVSFTCSILVSFLYILIVLLRKFVTRKKKFVNEEPYKNSINLQKETTDNNLSEVQNRKCTEKIDEARINRLFEIEMSTVNGIGTVTNVGSHFEWEINDFSTQCKEVGDSVLSPILVTTCWNNYVLWKLRLYPKGADVESKGYISLFIKCLIAEKVVGDVTFSVLNDEKCKRWGWRMNEKMFDNQKYISWGNPKFIQRHLIMDLNNRVLLNDTLKILCEIVLYPKDNNDLYVKHLNANAFDYILEQLNDFGNLLETGNGSDVTLRVDGFEIKAHKAFLISRSPVFQAMFQYEMKEKEGNVVEIVDIEYHIMKELLRFMYASKINDIQTNASGLLIASERYCIKQLKVLCEYELSRQIQFQNVFQLLELAATYNANFLKSQTILFIVTNKRIIVDRPEFKKFADLHADTVCEVFRVIARS